MNSSTKFSTKHILLAIIGIALVVGIVVVIKNRQGNQEAALFKAALTSKDATGVGSIPTGSLVASPNQTRLTCLQGDTTPRVKVMSPNGGESFTPGQQITVTWSTCNVSLSEKVVFSLVSSQNGNTYTTFTLNGSSWSLNDGTEVVTLPSTAEMNTRGWQPGNYYKINVLTNSDRGPTITDQSDNTFEVAQDPLVTFVWNTGVSDITKNSATLNGYYVILYRSANFTPFVNISTTGFFTYDFNQGLNNQTSQIPMQGSGGIPITGLTGQISDNLTGLTPNTTYCYRTNLKRTDVSRNTSTFNHAEPQSCFTTLSQ